ncbi:dentin sialophosphoprotein isoform X2 [Orussus abietinus]|uniref:dentin sialophosphoprotein isoform X2 n=1 Tax=Orussus abietinus TaxID=222816 RepID=UPI000626AE43|nr:dentin sialophosphoprotein isoform X2 [Orussus abietinus]
MNDMEKEKSVADLERDPCHMVERNGIPKRDLTESQSFRLRLSDSLMTVDDTYDGDNKNDYKNHRQTQDDSVVIISDSSDENTSDNSGWRKWCYSQPVSTNVDKNKKRLPSAYILQSSDSSDLDYNKKSSMTDLKNGGKTNLTESQEIMYTGIDKATKTNKQLSVYDYIDSESDINLQNICSISKKSNSIESSYISPTQERNITIRNIKTNVNRSNEHWTSKKSEIESIPIISHHTEKNNYVIKKALPKSKETLLESSCDSRTSSSTSSNKNTNEKSLKQTNSIFARKKDFKVKRIVKPTLTVYPSPTVSKEIDESDTVESVYSDEEGLYPTHSSDEREKNEIVNKYHKVINETDTGSDNEIGGSQIEISKPLKTHISRFFETPTHDRGYSSLSEHKKNEISRWILNNCPELKNDSSTSHISESNQNSTNSGNSSLERLEMNYETPNNRNRLPKPSVRQLTLDKIWSKATDVKRGFQTPVDYTEKKSEPSRLPNSNHQDVTPSSGTPEVNEQADLMKCANILDKLYGREWRAKANKMLPMTEPKKSVVLKRDKGIQTERRITSKSKNPKKKVIESDSEDEFDIFVKNVTPGLNSTKKQDRNSIRWRNNFINDESSSDSTSGTNYYTALTHIRESDVKSLSKSTPVSASTIRARTICDPDTEDEDTGSQKNYDNRRQLFFSEDESNSSTSEYDPGDEIPLKEPVKKSSTRIPLHKASTYTSSTYKSNVKKKTFLESLSASVPLENAHSDAKPYRLNFKNNKEELCKHLFKLYNEKIFDNKLPKDMVIEWNVRMRGTAGFCYNKKSIKTLGNVTRSSRIVLATKILDSPDRLRDTLVHEMCHAAAWLINAVSDGHGPFWRGWANKAMKMFPELPTIKRCHDYKIKTKYTYRCTKCGYSVGRHSKSLDIERKRCGHCYGKFELLINRTTKSGTVQMQTPTSKGPSGFALYVKENYHSVKKDRHSLKHGEVMKILGQQFSAIKIKKRDENVNDESP